MGEVWVFGVWFTFKVSIVFSVEDFISECGFRDSLSCFFSSFCCIFFRFRRYGFTSVVGFGIFWVED